MKDFNSQVERKIVMFSGYKNSGKNYFANLFTEYAKKEYWANVYSLSIASHIKKIYSYFFNISLEEIELQKNNPNSRVRVDLQNLGDALKKTFGTDVLAEETYQNMCEIEDLYEIQNNFSIHKPIYLITDWRFQHEFLYFEKFEKKPIRIRVIRDNNPSIHNDSHISENDLTDTISYYDYIIHNNIDNLDSNNLPDNIKAIFDKILKDDL